MVRKSCNMFVIDVCIIQSSTTDVCHLSTLRYCLIPILIQSSIKFLDTSGCSHDGSAMHCQSTNPTSTSFSRWNPAIPKEPLSTTRIFNKQSHPRSRSTSPRCSTYISNPSIPLERFQTGTIRGSTFLQKATPTRSGLGVLPPMVLLMILFGP